MREVCQRIVAAKARTFLARHRHDGLPSSTREPKYARGAHHVAAAVGTLQNCGLRCIRNPFLFVAAPPDTQVNRRECRERSSILVMTPNIVCVRGRYKSAWTRKNFGLRLVPAYALTVHKTQALSIKHLVLGCVALSLRARTLRHTVGRERAQTATHLFAHAHVLLCFHGFLQPYISYCVEVSKAALRRATCTCSSAGAVDVMFS